jgi:hypothetical protein
MRIDGISSPMGARWPSAQSMMSAISRRKQTILMITGNA